MEQFAEAFALWLMPQRWLAPDFVTIANCGVIARQDPSRLIIHGACGRVPDRRRNDPIRYDAFDNRYLLACENMVMGGIKHLVRKQAGARCVRCAHPYPVTYIGPDAPEWTPCDGRCTHGGPLRWRDGPSGQWQLKDDDDRAQVGIACGFEIEAQWRVLTVHHLDKDKANCRWWNLAALCQRCHLQIQGKVQMARIWPWEHSRWFEPYVAGYYAFVYLGEELSRREVEDRLDDLLKLERVA